MNGAVPASRAAQRLDHVAEHRLRVSGAVRGVRTTGVLARAAGGDRALEVEAGGEVRGDGLGLVLELAGGGVVVVAALGDGQRDDPHRRVGQLGEYGLGVVGREEVLRDRADHTGIPRPVGRFGDERVQAVLGGEGVAHARITWQQAHAADRPVAVAAGVHQRIEVHGLVRAMEPAHAEVDDADLTLLEGVLGHGDRAAGGDLGQGGGRQRSHGSSFIGE